MGVEHVQHRRPLWGFGLAGWVALVALTTLVVALLRGWDPVYAAAALLMHLSGATASNADLGRWVQWYWYLWASPALVHRQPDFSIVGLLYTLPAIFIAPGRLRRPAVIAVVISGLLQAYSIAIASGVARWMGTTPGAFVGQATFIPIVLTMGALGWLCRDGLSRALLGAAVAWRLGLMVLGWNENGMLFLPGGSVPLPNWLAVTVFHALVGAAVWYWAIRARATPAPAGRPCPSCSYDLSGLGDGAVCPECGGAQKPPASAASAPGP